MTGELIGASPNNSQRVILSLEPNRPLNARAHYLFTIDAQGQLQEQKLPRGDSKMELDLSSINGGYLIVVEADNSDVIAKASCGGGGLMFFNPTLLMPERYLVRQITVFKIIAGPKQLIKLLIGKAEEKLRGALFQQKID